MKIVMTGGGSGGHITPILAVAHELKKLDPTCHIIFVGQKGDSFAKLVSDNPDVDENKAVSAGKFRRYSNVGWRQLIDLPTVFLNIRDGFRVIIGFFQSFFLLGKLKPDVIFSKGGFVGVPVGLAAAIRKIPIVTHDSDAMVGLANRILSRWASLHAAALDPALYPYPANKTVNVGVPISSRHKPVSEKIRQNNRAELSLPVDGQVLLVTGGGLGAQKINQAMVAISKHLLHQNKKLAIVHTAGRQHQAVVSAAYDKAVKSPDRDRVSVLGYTEKLANYSAAADVVVARAGATSLAELSAQGDAAIIIPSPYLAGGHQLKNAAAYEKAGAVVVINESDLERNHELLRINIQKLLDKPAEREKLSKAILSFARPNAALDLAKLIISAVPAENNAKKDPK